MEGENRMIINSWLKSRQGRMVGLLGILLLEIWVLSLLHFPFAIVRLPFWPLHGKAVNERVPTLKVGSPAPPMRLTDEHGRRVKEDRLRGKKVAFLFVSSCSQG